VSFRRAGGVRRVRGDVVRDDGLTLFTGTATVGTGSSDSARLTVKGGAGTTCTSSSDLLTVGSPRNTGTSSLEFKACTQGGEECHALAGSGATIKFTGEWHFVLFTKVGVDYHVELYLIRSLGVHIECPSATIKLLLITGGLLGSITQKSGSTTEFTVRVSFNGTAQEFSEYDNEAGSAVKTKLETSHEGGVGKEPFENIEGLFSNSARRRQSKNRPAGRSP
jgi:hypothetical protein